MIKYRAISKNDISDIEEIAKFTWDGEDYLPNVFNKWIKDENFYGIEYNGKIIATGKITVLPCKVGWLEGLRVHINYRGRGFASKMHDFLIKRSAELHEEGQINSIEFATYFRNNVSISMGLKSGFKIVERFFGLNIDTGERKERPEIIDLESIENIDYEKYIPCGWKFLHRCDDSTNFIKKNCDVYRYKQVVFITPKNRPWEVTPFQLNISSVSELLPAFSYLTRDFGEEISIKIPSNLNYKEYEKIGLKKWENVTDPEIIILKKELVI